MPEPLAGAHADITPTLAALLRETRRPEYPYRRCQDCGGLLEEHDGRRCYDPGCPSGPNCTCGINPW